MELRRFEFGNVNCTHVGPKMIEQFEAPKFLAIQRVCVNSYGTLFEIHANMASVSVGLDAYFYLEWIACGYCWILTLIMAFYLCVIFYRRNAPIFKHRYLGLVCAINLCAIIFVGYVCRMSLYYLIAVFEITSTIQFLS